MSLLKKYLVKKKIIPNLLKQRSCQKIKKKEEVNQPKKPIIPS